MKHAKMKNAQTSSVLLSIRKDDLEGSTEEVAPVLFKARVEFEDV